MKYAVIENGKVANIVISESALDSNWVQSDVAKIGQLVDADGNFSDPPLTAEDVRRSRDASLEHFVDPLQTHVLKWNSLTPEKQAEWTQYRQDLLDVPQQKGFPDNVVWPTKPE